MNLREFYKKLKSPMGTTFLFLGALVLLVLLCLPLLLRDDAGKLEINRKGDGEGTYDIWSNIKAVATPPKHPRSGSEARKKTPAPLPAPAGSSAKVPRSPTAFDGKQNAPGFKQNAPGRFAGRTSKNTASRKPSITIIDGENAKSQTKEFVSERYAPYGRLISCKMVNTVESGDTETPLIAFVTEDLWWINSRGEKKLIIPAGTEVHGTVKGSKPLRNRLTTGNSFVLVWQATSLMVGFELQLRGIALEKSNSPDTKNLATISDMAAGIPGQVISNENLAKFLMYTLAFGQGMAQGFQTTEVAMNSGGLVSTQEGTTKNALARGSETLTQIMLQDISKQISKESYYIRVAAGTEFYLFVQQVINLDDAKIADTLLNKLEEKKIQGGQQRKSARNILNAFSQKQ
ncbi:MAG: TrbI/VirB10 family protein [Victivallaceae bacterium]|nr:TrbI/VirB10 family protein [Victivallaceae bacterium]